MCVPVLAKSGRFDIFTELRMRCDRRPEEERPLVQLKQDTIRACRGEDDLGKSLAEQGHESLDDEDDEEFGDPTEKVDLTDPTEESRAPGEEVIEEAEENERLVVE